MDQDIKLQYFSYVLSQLLQRYVPPPVTDRAFADVELPVEREHLKSWLEDCMPHLPARLWKLYKERHGNDKEKLIAAALLHNQGLKEAGGKLILLGDEYYPPLLAAIADPPLAINVLGNLRNLRDQHLTAIVGARRATPYALKESFALGKLLAREGTGVVSGGAYGCDIAAHHGVLANCLESTPAVVVFAGGLAQLYPAANREVFASIREGGGTLVSERLWHSVSRPADFPVRNRIIAGIVPRLVIMQAAVSSGAMHTAGRALAYGREVFALVHQGLGDAFSGNMRLLLDGAIGFSDAESLCRNEYIGFRLLNDEWVAPFQNNDNFLV